MISEEEIKKIEEVFREEENPSIDEIYIVKLLNSYKDQKKL